MTADVIDFVAALDENCYRQAERLGLASYNHGSVDNGQEAYEALPESVRRALLHLAILPKHAWPPANLVVAIAMHHGADPGLVLCASGWMPPEDADLTLEHRACMEFARDFAARWAMDLECVPQHGT